MSLLALLDSCVLVPAGLSDTLFYANLAHLYRMRFSPEILEEARRTLVNKLNISEEGAQRIISKITENFDESIVTGYESRIDKMPINAKDRHVLAAAVICKAQIVVTQNLKHFPQRLLDPFEIEALSPDRFLLQLFHSDPESIAVVLKTQAMRLYKPPKTELEVLENLRLFAPNFVKLLREEFGYPEKFPWSDSLELKSGFKRE